MHTSHVPAHALNHVCRHVVQRHTFLLGYERCSLLSVVAAQSCAQQQAQTEQVDYMGGDEEGGTGRQEEARAILLLHCA